MHSFKKCNLLLLAAACLLACCLLSGCGQQLGAASDGLVPESATEIDLRGKNLTGEQLAALSASTQLVRLDLRDNAVSAEQFEALQAALPGCTILWSVPLGAETFDSASTSLTLPALEAAQLPRLRYFPELTQVDATNCVCYDALLSISRQMPDCTFLWHVSLGGQSVLSTDTTVDLSGEQIAAADLTAALAYLPALTSVRLPDHGIDASAVADLVAQNPAIDFSGNVSVCGKSLPLGATSLDLTGAAAFDAAELAASLACFPDATAVDLSGLAVTPADAEALMQAAPQLTIAWDFELAGVPVSAGDTQIDLSGKPIEDLDAFTENLKYLTAPTTLNMSDCGLTDEQMGALCERYPNVKFIWYVTVGRWQIRTDADAFSTGNEHSTEKVRYTKKGATNLTTEDIAPLRYCTDLVALDIGHKRRIKDISVIEHMPKLRFLIIAMEGFTDLSPVASCTELEYLETFQNHISDLSPLLSLKKLTHLNCSTNAIGSIDVLKQMTQLQRLWCIRCELDDAQIDALKAALPDCVINTTGTHSTSNGWRKNDLYREMQKLFGLAALE